MKLPVIQHGLVYQGIEGGPFVVGQIVALDHGTKSMILPVIQHGLLYQGIDGGPYVVGRTVTLTTEQSQ